MAYHYKSGIAGTTAPQVMDASAKPKKKSSHGVVGFLENLGKDVGETARGIPAGIVETVRHPVKSVEEMGKTTWHDWSPLFHGNLSKFGHQFYAHPLGPLLDMTAFIDGGASLAGRVAKGLDAADLAAKGGKVARLAEYSRGGKIGFHPVEGEGDRSMFKELSKNPATRAKQEAVHALANKLGGYMPSVFGKEARYDRMFARHTALRKAAMMTQLATMVDAGKKLTGKDAGRYERIATAHTYDQFHTMAFRHPANEPVPEHFQVIKADPTEQYAAGVRKARTAYNTAAKRVARGRDVLSQKHGILVSTRNDLDAQIGRHTTEIKRLQKAQPTHPNIQLYQGDVQAMQDLRGKFNDMNKAKRSLDGKRRAYATAHTKFFDKNAGTSFEDHLANLDKRYLVSPDEKGNVDLSLAKKVDGGKSILIVPKHDAKNLGVEGARSSNALKKLYHSSTGVWKSIILGYRPAFFVNNFVGNSLMYAMSHDPVTAFRGLHDALRNAKHDDPAIASDLDKAVSKMKGGWQDRYFKDQLTNTLADSSLTKFTSDGSRAKQSKVRQGLFGVTHNAADKFFRRATLQNLMRDHLGAKAKGLSPEDFAKLSEKTLADDAKNGGHLRRGMSEKVMNTMGDYHSYTGAEKAVRELVPFYAWDRHIARHIKDMYTHHSAKLDALAKTGQLGTEETEKILGDIPRFLQNSIPLSLLGLHIDHPSRHAILTTQGLNPYSTIPELEDMLTGAEGGSDAADSIGGALNPFVQAGIGQLTGTDPASGAPVKKKGGGLIGEAIGTVEGPATSLPQVVALEKLLKNGLTKPEKGKVNKRTHIRKTNLYEKSALEALLGLVGAPYKQESPRAAKKLKRAEG